MQLTLLALILALLTVIGFLIGRSRAASSVGGRVAELHSVPSYHGVYVALWAGLPALLLFVAWTASEGWLAMQLVLSALPDRLTTGDGQSVGLLKADILNLAHGIATGREADPLVAEAARRYAAFRDLADWSLLAVVASLAVAGLAWGRHRIGPDLRARPAVERVVRVALVVCSLVAILTTVGIVLSLLFEALRFFTVVSPLDFLFGTHWSPQTAMRADQVGSSGSFGAIPLFAGTLLITVIAMLVAVPVGLMAAIYMSEYAGRGVRTWLKPALEILAGIPTVVYGFFAALTMAPFVRSVGEALGLDVSSESALAAGIVMGVMIIPFVSSLSDDVINAVPQSLRDGSYGLGATKSETIRQVVLPAALPGIVAAVMLAVSRAIGETMIVTMASGLTANMTANPLQAVTTVTTQIATLLVGDQEFDSPKTLSAFGLGLVLFLVTLCLNMVALRVVRTYREKYD
ncbi:phosphate ABC transporter permease subunit PstC [Azospirillum oryzae]|uniref:Phosphate transport system permease protein n=1 Tax=Azospirillum oryzae TaxID=286727 RepID=A0A6N1APC0_9PROT|nr:phosphate ABC transporter permease subunit PstC [Azospirillum oryzae]KAA0586037.1 phosphate ABC transporter permease subunit PstC [Azospirillum oryzae]QKS50914.1 phosphate ABC transporter permease subunit PstC [Azospirillum oryzae]GLR79262.1 phosphate transport system permease protein [Azospirillum oryzae]